MSSVFELNFGCSSLCWFYSVLWLNSGLMVLFSFAGWNDCGPGDDARGLWPGSYQGRREGQQPHPQQAAPESRRPGCSRSAVSDKAAATHIFRSYFRPAVYNCVRRYLSLRYFWRKLSNHTKGFVLDEDTCAKKNNCDVENFHCSRTRNLQCLREQDLIKRINVMLLVLR